jgi:hypothetical protein
MKKGDRSWALAVVVSFALLVLALLPAGAETQGAPPQSGDTQIPAARSGEVIDSD